MWNGAKGNETTGIKTEETMWQSDMAGNWTNLLFLDHLITVITFNKKATVHLHGLTTGQMRRRCRGSYALKLE